MAEDKWYELRAAKPAASGSTAIILEGSYDAPKKVMHLGETMQLSKAEYEQNKDLYVFREVKSPMNDTNEEVK